MGRVVVIQMRYDSIYTAYGFRSGVGVCEVQAPKLANQVGVLDESSRGTARLRERQVARQEEENWRLESHSIDVQVEIRSNQVPRSNE